MGGARSAIPLLSGGHQAGDIPAAVRRDPWGTDHAVRSLGRSQPTPSARILRRPHRGDHGGGAVGIPAERFELTEEGL